MDSGPRKVVDWKAKRNYIAKRVMVQFTSKRLDSFGRNIPTNTNAAASLLVLAEECFVVNRIFGIIVKPRTVTRTLPGDKRRYFSKVFWILQKLVKKYALFKVRPLATL